MNPSLDFGYPWWLSYGHLALLAPALVLLALGLRFHWPRWCIAVISLIAVWSGAAVLATHFVFDVNGRAKLPTQGFLASGEGRVLDLGAGTGRSSIMVLEARPRVSLVALDLFADSFEHHFGKGLSLQQKLLANLKTAGVDQRATIETADMRKLPFEAAAFDGIVSAYAVDHLNREGVKQSLSEAARVLKPGGEFLLILVANDAWAKFCYGPMLTHGGTRGLQWWQGKLREAGFHVVEQGTQPITQYLLARRPLS